jgi:hypothetical protein
MTDLREVAESIVGELKNAGYNNVQDSSGYYTIKELEDCDFNRVVDLSKTKEDGREYYAVFCSYENEDSDWKFTNDLSVDSLLEVLQEVYDSEPTES